jgi:hypothetical protein
MEVQTHLFFTVSRLNGQFIPCCNQGNEPRITMSLRQWVVWDKNAWISSTSLPYALMALCLAQEQRYFPYADCKTSAFFTWASRDFFFFVIRARSICPIRTAAYRLILRFAEFTAGSPKCYLCDFTTFYNKTNWIYNFRVYWILLYMLTFICLSRTYFRMTLESRSSLLASHTVPWRHTGAIDRYWYVYRV